MGYLVQYRKNNLKNSAIEMRKRGLSYNEIKNLISISKGTLSRWFKGVQLTEVQRKKLDDRRRSAAARGSKTRKLKTREAIEKIKLSSAKDVKKISPRELWLMGIVLYWRERFLHGEERDTKQGVNFSSSNPNLIKFFLKWLRDVGGLKSDEIQFAIFIGKSKKDSIHKAVGYWSRVTEFSRESFSRFYLQSENKRFKKSLREDQVNETTSGIDEENSKSGENRKSRKPVKRGKHGFLQIKVRASSMLARQISGWINGIQSFLLDS